MYVGRKNYGKYFQLKILHNSFAIPRKNQMQCNYYIVKEKDFT